MGISAHAFRSGGDIYPEQVAVSEISRSSHRSSNTAPHRIPVAHLAAILALWLVIFFAALASPAILDDADGTHAQAARAMLSTGDWVTLHVDGLRYLEKPPLPYWLVAISFRIFGANVFAAHLPNALAVLALALLGYVWSRRAFNTRTALYAALAVLTSTGVFLFTRVFIPDALFSLFLAIALYALLQALADDAPRFTVYLLWTALALAVLTKGLVALIFFFATAVAFLAFTGRIGQWRRLKPFAGFALFLLIAAPWHILATLRNTGGENGHGFGWFYFINEHVLRFLGNRTPRDYNKLPAALYWSLHLVWLFPWSLFAPLAVWQIRRRSQPIRALFTTPAACTALLLAVFSAVVLLFFAFSTNQEYYTFPAYLPLLMLVTAGIAKAEVEELRRPLVAAHIAFAVIGLLVATTLAYGLYTARHYPYTSDIGALLAHRGIGAYTLSLSSFFDLTGPSFAALRLPATLALTTFLIGPAVALILRYKRAHLAATATVALTSAAFLVAAHIALVRFEPVLSSRDFATTIDNLAVSRQIEPGAQVILFGDQAYGSSLAFYLNRPVLLVEGRTTSMYFGSTFPDAPKIFLTQPQLLAQWGNGPRKILFVPIEHRAEAGSLPHVTVLAESSGKLLLTDRPLTPIQ